MAGSSRPPAMECSSNFQASSTRSVAPSSCSARWSTAMPTWSRISGSSSASGINLGDVIAEVGDIYGDGVNVAARLEALAEPGGICISGTVWDHIRDKLPYRFEDTGEQSVKNIARPVRVYAMDAEPSLRCRSSRRDRRRSRDAAASTNHSC